MPGDSDSEASRGRPIPEGRQQEAGTEHTALRGRATLGCVAEGASHPLWCQRSALLCGREINPLPWLAQVKGQLRTWSIGCSRQRGQPLWPQFWVLVLNSERAVETSIVPQWHVWGARLGWGRGAGGPKPQLSWQQTQHCQAWPCRLSGSESYSPSWRQQNQHPLSARGPTGHTTLGLRTLRVGYSSSCVWLCDILLEMNLSALFGHQHGGLASPCGLGVSHCWSFTLCCAQYLP